MLPACSDIFDKKERGQKAIALREMGWQADPAILFGRQEHVSIPHLAVETSESDERLCHIEPQALCLRLDACRARDSGHDAARLMPVTCQMVHKERHEGLRCEQHSPVIHRCCAVCIPVEDEAEICVLCDDAAFAFVDPGLCRIGMDAAEVGARTSVDL